MKRFGGPSGDSVGFIHRNRIRQTLTMNALPFQEGFERKSKEALLVALRLYHGKKQFLGKLAAYFAQMRKLRKRMAK
jgi:hypothetical protein